MLRAMQKKSGTQVASPEAEKLFLERSGNLSGADIEAVLIRARDARDAGKQGRRRASTT